MVTIKKFVNHNAGYGLLFTGAYFFIFFANETFHTPIIYSVVLFALGTVVWFTLSLRNTKKKIRAIEKTGFYNPKISKSLAVLVVALLVSVIVLLGGILIFFNSVRPFLFLMAFFVPTFPAFSLVPAVYGWLWQRRNKRTLYLSGNILYPFPYINPASSKGIA
jgi:hypothetical protein